MVVTKPVRLFDCVFEFSVLSGAPPELFFRVCVRHKGMFMILYALALLSDRTTCSTGTGNNCVYLCTLLHNNSGLKVYLIP